MKMLRKGEDTHSKKRNFAKRVKTRGATPIEKNVLVVDEQGNEYEATYPKRAKGLVKNGRARFVGENKICLACPPNAYLEDIKMTDRLENLETTAADGEKKQNKYSLDYFFEQIEKIESQSASFEQSLREVCQMETGGPADIAGSAKAQAISEMIRSRETTNQQLLSFYTSCANTIIGEMANITPDQTVKRFEELAAWLKTQNRDEYEPDVWNTLLEAAKTQLL